MSDSTYLKGSVGMGILSWIVVGAIAGLLAQWLMGTEGGWVVTILLGIVGAIIGGWIMSFFGLGGVDAINIWSILVATLGAVVLLFLKQVLIK